MRTRQMGAIPPSAILSRKGIARYGGGISHWAAKSMRQTEPFLPYDLHPREGEPVKHCLTKDTEILVRKRRRCRNPMGFIAPLRTQIPMYLPVTSRPLVSGNSFRKVDFWLVFDPVFGPAQGLIFRTSSTTTRDRNLQLRGAVSTGGSPLDFLLFLQYLCAIW